MRYINLRLTYLLTYLLTSCLPTNSVRALNAGHKKEHKICTYTGQQLRQRSCSVPRRSCPSDIRTTRPVHE